MEEKRPTRPRLRLIQGALACGTLAGKVRIVAAPKDSPPFRVQAVAFEEDTFLVLSADPTVRDPKVPLVRIMTRLMQTQPEVPGTLKIREGSPVRLLAVIHDLNRDPSWKEEWIEAAMSRIFEASERRGFHSLAMPLLGTVHGTLARERSVRLLAEQLKERPLQHLRRLWLVAPSGSARDLIGFLERELAGEARRDTP